jgi:cell division initiation protein
MALTQLEIHNKEFGIKFRGYDEDEVNDFLDLIEQDYEYFVNRIRELEDKNFELAHSLENYQEIERRINNSTVDVEEETNRLRSQAEKEYELIIKESQKNADRIVNDALLKQKQVHYEIEDMRRSAAAFRTRFRSLLEAEIDILDRYHLDDKEVE